MEFRKMTPGPVQPAAALPPPESNLRAHLRLMARRQLHGSRGLLYIIGSLLFVISLGRFATTSGLFGNLAGGTHAVFNRWSADSLNHEEWSTLFDVAISLFVISCGWIIVRKPRLATRLPILILVIKGALDLALPLSRDEQPAINAIVIHIALAAVLIKAARDAGAFHRDVVALQLHVQRSTAPSPPAGWRARLPGYPGSAPEAPAENNE